MRITTPANPNVQVVGTVPVAVQPQGYGASFTSITAKAANTAEQMVAAAANTNGLQVWQATYQNVTASNAEIAILAKATTPANCADGDFIAMGGGATSASGTDCSTRLPVLIAAGKALWRISQNADGSCGAGVRYTLL